MTPRFIKQRDKYNCVPLAILNAAKYWGIKCSYADVKDIGKAINTRKDGTLDDNLFNALNTGIFGMYGLEVNPTLKGLDVFLKKEIPVIVSVANVNENFEHAFLIIGKTDKTYKCVNFAEDRRTLSYIRRSTIKRILKTDDKNCYAVFTYEFFD